MGSDLTKNNYAKKPRYFFCDSDKYKASNDICIEEESKDDSVIYLHLPKCIIRNRPYRADFDHYLLKPVYSKLMGFIKRTEGPNISQIRG